MTARWSEALDHQVSTFAFWDSVMGVRYAEGYMADVVEKGRIGMYPDAAQLATNQAAVMLAADTVMVDDDMLTLVESAAPSFEVEPLREEDLFVRMAFVWLPRPIRVRDVHDRECAYRAIAWAPTPLVMQNSTTGERLPAVPGLIVTFYSLTSDRDDYYDDGRMWSKVFNHDLSLMHYLPWQFGQSWFRDETATPGAYTLLQFTQALWRIMGQEIAVHTRQQPERATRKRLQRAGLDPERLITYVTLRRPRKAPGDDHVAKHVEWSHRWLVSGHWRNQWYASLGIHRQIWVNPYIKGPDDAPLEVRQKRVFALTR